MDNGERSAAKAHCPYYPLDRPVGLLHCQVSFSHREKLTTRPPGENVSIFPAFPNSFLQGHLCQAQGWILLWMGLLATSFFNESIEFAPEGDNAGQEGIQLHIVQAVILGP